jgi:hypothetical protein
MERKPTLRLARRQLHPQQIPILLSCIHPKPEPILSNQEHSHPIPIEPPNCRKLNTTSQAPLSHLQNPRHRQQKACPEAEPTGTSIR